MIYIDQNKIVAGRANRWRVFADDAEELRGLVRDYDIRPAEIENAGQPNEHLVLTTTQKNKIKGAIEVGERALVKLIRAKRFIAAIVPFEPVPDPDPVIKRGGVTITTKSDEPYPDAITDDQPEDDEDDDEAME